MIEDAGFGDFFTHRVGHHVGLNVHDPGDKPLAPGMVVTIEPGIYVPEGADVDPKFWNLGVRIEDSYVITEDGWEVITSYPWRPAGVRQETEAIRSRSARRRPKVKPTVRPSVTMEYTLGSSCNDS